MRPKSESLLDRTTRQINEAMAASQGIELIRDFGEIGREKNGLTEVSYTLHLRRWEHGLIADFRAMTHARRRRHTSVPLYFGSLADLRQFFSGLPADPGNWITRQPFDPERDRLPFFDRLFLKWFGGLLESRRLRDHRMGKHFRARLWACLEKKRGPYFLLMADATGPHGTRQTSLALPLEIFANGASGLLKVEESETTENPL